MPRARQDLYASLTQRKPTVESRFMAGPKSGRGWWSVIRRGPPRTHHNPDSARFPTRPDYLAAIAATDYDIVINDLFHEDADGNPISLTAADLAAIRTKGRGGSRLLVCYLSIGEAESYRYYWQAAWARASGRPSWLAEENPDWPGNHKVEYWDPEWQAILLGSDGAYLERILAAGFDGVYLDIIDAYEYFEAAVGR